MSALFARKRCDCLDRPFAQLVDDEYGLGGYGETQGSSGDNPHLGSLRWTSSDKSLCRTIPAEDDDADGDLWLIFGVAQSSGAWSFETLSGQRAMSRPSFDGGRF